MEMKLNKHSVIEETSRQAMSEGKDVRKRTHDGKK